jgi:hypothetical protein
VESILLCLELHVQSQVSDTSCILFGSAGLEKTIYAVWRRPCCLSSISTLFHDATLFHAKHLRYEIFQTISWTPRLDASCQVSFAAKAACATYFIGPRGHTATQSVPPWALSFRDKCGLGFVFASGFLILCCILPDGHFASSMSFRISMSDEWVHPMRRQNRT